MFRMIRRLAILLAALCWMAVAAYGQINHLDVRFRDGLTERPVAGVRVRNQAGELLAVSDTSGICTLGREQAEKADYLVAESAGYVPDTLRELRPDLYLQPLNRQLEDVVIHSKKCRLFWNNAAAYVIDYLFVGKNVLVAAHIGGKGPRNRLVLLSPEGEELAECALPEEAVKLFESCLGFYYCVFHHQFCSLTVTDHQIKLEKTYSNNLFNGLARCEQCLSGNQFFRVVDRDHFLVNYTMRAHGESQTRPLMRLDERSKKPYTLLHIHDQNAAQASYEEYQQILAEWNGEEFHEAYRKQLVRKTLDLATIAHINIPLYTTNDTLLVFDYHQKQILFYNSAGRPLGQVPAGFRWTDAQRFVFLKDALQDRLFIQRYDNPMRETIEELTPATGRCTGIQTVIGKPLPENIKVNDGNIYLLSQDAAAHTTRQLFVQPLQP